MLMPMPGNEAMAASLAVKLEWVVAQIDSRKFPDGETYLKIVGEVTGRDIVLVCTLDRPDTRFLPLVFAADAARELGASTVHLVAPYLAYMRQDRRFHAGEAVTSHSFARLISGAFDGLVTIDPHLHRYRSLADIYTTPTHVLQAAEVLADWIGKHVANPILIGPDSESAQWVGEAAVRIGAPFTVFDKIRSGDRDVSVQPREPSLIASGTPVLVDDIISSGETMLAAARVIREISTSKPVCAAVHGIFAQGAYERLAPECATIATCNTVIHPTNAIDVTDLLAEGVHALLGSKQGNG
jgi:ribose-phosphate pyrophosphokinase